MTRQRDIEAWRGIALILACFAVSLRLAIPMGFMPGVTAEGRTGLVLCVAGTSPHQQSPEQAPADREHCVFAGSAVTPVETAALALPIQTFAYTPVAFSAWRDLAPGRGLTAPPPPAIGPPLRSA